VLYGSLICDRSQVCLPLALTPIAWQRCKGQGITYRFKGHGVEVIGGKRVTCPECGGEGKMQTVIYPPMLSSGAFRHQWGQGSGHHPDRLSSANSESSVVASTRSTDEVIVP
jgi:hypothetical protein